jgi:hypothetical protein
MQFLVQIEWTKTLDNTIITDIKLGNMMLTLPTFIEHNNDYVMNGTSLRCSPPKSSNQHFNKKNGIGEDLGIK